MQKGKGFPEWNSYCVLEASFWHLSCLLDLLCRHYGLHIVSYSTATIRMSVCLHILTHTYNVHNQHLTCLWYESKNQLPLVIK